MKSVSLKIDEKIFGETEKVRSKIKISRNRYINEAIDHYNEVNQRKLLKILLRKESNVVRDDSLEVLRDFEDLENDD